VRGPAAEACRWSEGLDRRWRLHVRRRIENSGCCADEPHLAAVALKHPSTPAHRKPVTRVQAPTQMSRPRGARPAR